MTTVCATTDNLDLVKYVSALARRHILGFGCFKLEATSQEHSVPAVYLFVCHLRICRLVTEFNASFGKV